MIGIPIYEAKSHFHFECQVLRFIDNRIRFRYYMDPKELVIGKFMNSSKAWTKGKIDIDYINLKRTSGYKNEFRFEYNNDKLFNKLPSYQVLLFSNETHLLDLYNGW